MLEYWKARTEKTASPGDSAASSLAGATLASKAMDETI
jgi:hypothetical protein